MTDSVASISELEKHSNVQNYILRSSQVRETENKRTVRDYRNVKQAWEPSDREGLSDSAKRKDKSGAKEVKERMANTREVEEWKRAKDAEANFKNSGQKPLVLPVRRRSKARNDGIGKAPKSNAGPEDDAGLFKLDDMPIKKTNTQSGSTSEKRKDRTDRREIPA
ncbi:hypothetical protein EAF04_010574 [Stromatinia cepivora]|nr:hypothetical protein EAF04_010574 [Stromatinia cepivora]